MALEERAYCLSCLPDVAQLQLLQSALRTVQNALAERDAREAAAREAAVRDWSKEVATSLFQPFKLDIMPRELNDDASIDHLQRLLEMPTKPVAFISGPEYAHTRFFRSALDGRSEAHTLGARMPCAVAASPLALRAARGCELEWRLMFARFFSEMARARELVAVGDGMDKPAPNVITRRDLVLYPPDMQDVACVVGEFTSADFPLSRPVGLLLDKHSGSTAAQYGELRYVLAVAAAGPQVQFFALPISVRRKEDMRLIKVTDVLHLNTLEGRCDVLRAAINMMRWVKTVRELIPDDARLPVGKREPNDDVYGGSAVVTVFAASYAHVVKKIRCTVARLRALRMVLFVTPVGFRAMPKSCEELRHAIACVLTILKEAHARSVCHRDLRWPNVLKLTSHQWVVIDWQMAHKAGEVDGGLVYAPACWPPDLNEPYTYKHDLGQVGELIGRSVHADEHMLALAADLRRFCVKDAATALLRLLTFA